MQLTSLHGRNRNSVDQRSGSQPFITFVPTSHLNGKHTAFGRVIEGMDVLAKLHRRDPSDPSDPEPDKIISAEVVRKRDALAGQVRKRSFDRAR